MAFLFALKNAATALFAPIAVLSGELIGDAHSVL
jgi:hypothetical protein